jgi:short subunit dehydrogenase-like uncharacterized protein
MIYGANGYSATLALRKAVGQGLKPILSGRNKAAIEALAAEHGLQSRIFDLSDVAVIAQNLSDVKIVSHCAGPFSATAEPMMKACIESGTHYTDITGELDVFTLSQSLDKEAKAAGAVLCPGVGFDVIPTDCVANKLKEALPDATHLTLGFQGDNSLSPGTAKTMIEAVSAGMKVLRNGELVSVPPSFELRSIDFGNGVRSASVIPWGDLATAHWQTGIPNISVYTARKTSKVADVVIPLVQRVMKIGAVQNFARKKIEQKVKGPDEQAREGRDTYVFLWSTKEKAVALRLPN